MLATHTPSLSLHSSPSTARPSPLSSSRPALADATNVNSRSNVYGLGHSKDSVYPTSSIRTGCSWSDFESSTGSIPTSCHPRHYHLSSTPSLFPVTYKAPPTVSISLSAACSQRIPGGQFCGSKVQGLEPDLPDVRSVVPFPITPLDGDVDVDMFNGTGVPDGQLPSTGQAPRKRRSAHSSVSSSQGSIRKDAKQKRQRKSRRQVAELWWLDVVHRSISRGMEVRRSVGELDASDGLLSGLRDFDAMDRVLVERIRKRLAENDCVEGRAMPNPLSRISSPSISEPTLNLLAPSRKTLPISSELNQNGNGTPDGASTFPSVVKASPSVSLSIASHSLAPSSKTMSRRRHVHFEIPQRPCQAQLRPSIPRRSPSPPARTGTVPTNVQMLTLTMPQLVASLTLAYRERNRLRLRARVYKVTERGNNASRSPSSALCYAVQRSSGDEMRQERVQQSLALSNAPERRSPLSRVVYAES